MGRPAGFRKDMMGFRSGRLVVIGRSERKIGRSYYWLCKCDCGNEKEVCGYILRSGKTISCGCAQRESASRRGKDHHSFRHGMSKEKVYGIWEAMIWRCTSPNCKAWANYGGRGISVAEEWMGPRGFDNWYAHIGPRPSVAHTMDRIDVNGNYCPGNIRWSTWKVQNNNKRPRASVTACEAV